MGRVETVSETDEVANASLDDLKATLWTEHGVTVTPDDPVLMIHTIHKSFIEDLKKLLDGRDQNIKGVAAQVAAAASAEMNQTIKEFREAALSAGLGNKLETIAQQVEINQSIQSWLKRALFALTALFVTSLATLALGLGSLFYVLK